MARNRVDRPKHYRGLKSNSSVRRAIKTIGDRNGLPPGSVVIVLPSGRKARSDGTIGALRRAWEKE